MRLTVSNLSYLNYGKRISKSSSTQTRKNRCQLTGRPKGYMRYFGMCRNIFRDMALDGKIPGVRKASW